MDKIFYILWNPESSHPPRVTMDTHEEAVEVAEDMARRHREKFYIMKAVGSAEVVVPVRVKQFKTHTTKKASLPPADTISAGHDPLHDAPDVSQWMHLDKEG